MIANASSQDLATKIEQLVREHIAASREVAKAAVERAFAEAEMESAPEPQRTKPNAQRLQRRAPSEVAELGERFYSMVCQTPGETMAVLAGKLGATAQELKVPVAQLKRADRVRGVGQRSHMRYFPMASESKGEKEAEA